MRAHILVAVLLILGLTGCGGCGGSGPGVDGGGTQCTQAVTTPDGGGFCGDRVIEAPEECDDGNRVAGDGCDCSCNSELPASCAAEAIVDLADAGQQNGLFLNYTGTVANRHEQLEPPAGCQDQGGGGGAEVVHRFNLPIKADLVFSTANATTQLDSVLYQVDTCTPGPAPEGTLCNDDVSAQSQIFQSQLFSPSVEPGPHFLVVDTYDRGSSAPAFATYSLDVQIRPVLASGQPCDPNRVGSRCEDGYVCTAAAPTCALGAAPQLTGFQYLNLGNSVLRLVMTGTDANADVSDFKVEFLDMLGQPISLGGQTEFALAFDQNVLGQASFTASSTLNFAGVGSTLPPQARVRVRDVSNYESAKQTAALTPIPERAVSAACDAKKLVDRCAMGSFCKESAPGSASGSCTAGAAPSLVNAQAFTAPDGSRRVSINATDSDGDIERVVLTFKDAAGAVVAVDANNDTLVETPSVLGFAQSVGTVTFAGITGLAPRLFPATSTITQVSVKARDATGLDSGEVTVPFNPLPEIAAGAACDARRWDNYCGQAAPLCESSGCVTAAVSASAACGAAQELPIGTPVTGSLTFGADRWKGPCSDTGGSAGSEKVFKFTTTETTDLFFTTDFPETTLDTVVYVSNACGEALTATACGDDIDFRGQNFKSDGFVRNVAPGTHYLFVDSWTSGVLGAGAGDFKVLLKAVPVLTASGAACDPLLSQNRCGAPLRCTPNAGYTAFSCQ